MPFVPPFQIRVWAAALHPAAAEADLEKTKDEVSTLTQKKESCEVSAAWLASFGPSSSGR